MPTLPPLSVVLNRFHPDPPGSVTFTLSPSSTVIDASRKSPTLTPPAGLAIWILLSPAAALAFDQEVT